LLHPSPDHHHHQSSIKYNHPSVLGPKNLCTLFK
jgi:hypothetical protein